MKIGVILQARMSSQRLAGKVLMPLYGKPMLSYLLERLSHCKEVNQIIVATSLNASDQPIADFCDQHGILCFRGSLEDVASRFKEAASHYQLDAFLRVNGDSPLLDPALVDRGVQIFCQHHPDLVTNVYPRSYPKGQSVEVVNFHTFQQAYPQMQTPAQREHVTQFFYQHPSQFQMINFSADDHFSEIQLSVDTQQDLQHIKNILAKMTKPHWQYGFLEIIELAKPLC